MITAHKKFKRTISLVRTPAYCGIAMDHVVTQTSLGLIAWYGDPAVAASFKLGVEMFLSLYQESYNLNTILDLGQSPRPLERFSLSHLSPLPGHLIIVSFWHTGNSRRSMAVSVSGYLKPASYIPSLSPTLRWTCDVLFSLSDANQIFDLAGKAGVLNNLLPIGVSLRSTLVANLLLAGLTYKSPGITYIMRRMKIDKIEQDVVMYPDVDSLIGRLSPLSHQGDGPAR